MTDVYQEQPLTAVISMIYEDEIDRLKNRIEALEAALRWYAENCAANGDKIEGPSGDYGQRARAALEGEKKDG